MFEYFFYLMGIIAIAALAVGFLRRSFGIAILGSIILIMFGGLVLSEGVDIPQEKQIRDVNSDVIVLEPKYIKYTATNNPAIFIVGNAALYGGIASILGCMGLLILGRRKKDEY